MYNLNQNVTSEPISVFQRLVGYGTMLLGAFALYYCISFIDDLWNTPQRTAAIVVTLASLITIFIGVVIGFPEFLPKKIVALSLLLFGILSMLIGVLILVWFAYNVFVARQKGFRMGNPSLAVSMVLVGAGIAAKSFSKLGGRENRRSTDSIT